MKRMRFALGFGVLVLLGAACGGSDDGELFDQGGNSGEGGGAGSTASGGASAGSAGVGAGGVGTDASSGGTGNSAGSGTAGDAATGGTGAGGEPGVGGGSGAGVGGASGSAGIGPGGSAGAGLTGGTSGTGGSSGAGGGKPYGEIVCGNSVCSIPGGEFCCHRDGFQQPICRKLGEQCFGDLPILCDGPEDCPGSVCCGNTETVGFPFPTTRYVRVECKSSTSADQCDVVLCDPGGSNVCESGTSCEDSSALPDGYHVCK